MPAAPQRPLPRTSPQDRPGPPPASAPNTPRGIPTCQRVGPRSSPAGHTPISGSVHRGALPDLEPGPGSNDMSPGLFRRSPGVISPAHTDRSGASPQPGCSLPKAYRTAALRARPRGDSTTLRDQLANSRRGVRCEFLDGSGVSVMARLARAAAFRRRFPREPAEVAQATGFGSTCWTIVVLSSPAWLDRACSSHHSSAASR
jgi:hypothetical protein